MTAQFVFLSAKFNLNIAARGQCVPRADSTEPALLQFPSKDELTKSQFWKESVIHLQVFPVQLTF